MRVGRGEIAHAIATADIPVVLKDVDQKFVDQGIEKARSLWEARVSDGKLEPAERDRKLGLITGSTGYEKFGDVDFVIEAVPERMEVKQAVFSELDAVTPGHAILASNTSSLSITEMGEVTSRPEQVVGFHFFYPASVMRLIEVVEGEDTSAETAQAAANFASAIRKMPIRCGEAPGFVVNRILNSAVSELWLAFLPGGDRTPIPSSGKAVCLGCSGADRPLSSSPACSRPGHRQWCTSSEPVLAQGLRRTFLCPSPDAGAGGRRRPGRQDRKGLL